MPRHNFFRCFSWLITGLFFSLVSLAGCGISSENMTATVAPSPVASPSVLQAPPIRETVTLTTTNVITKEITPPVSEAITLTMWTTEAFSPMHSDLGSQTLKQQVAEFTNQNAKIGVDFVLKKAYGEGGIRDFLQSTGAVVPQRLPDLAIVDIADLPELARGGLLRPLEGLVSQELQQDLFPVAIESCTTEGHLVGIPFEVDLLHLAYNSKIVESPPLTWQQVLSGAVPYIFLAGGEDGEQIGASFWLQLLALNPDGLDLGENPSLDEETLVEVFGFYRQGIQAGVIPETVLDYRSEADVWSAYLSDKAAMTDISSFRYLNNRAVLRDTSFAQIPTQSGRPFSLAKGWALVIVATEPARQSASAKFLEWLLQPENNGAWTKASDRMPAIRSALAIWDQSDPYVSFAQNLLEETKPHPDGLNYDLAARALQRGLIDVVTGAALPEEAARSAISVMNPLIKGD